MKNLETISTVAESWSSYKVFEFLASGLVVVLGTLFFLSVITFLVGKIFEFPGMLERRREARKDSALAEAQEKKSSGCFEDGITPELIAVISAAAAEVLDKPFKLINVGEVSTGASNWSLAGRSSHHSSHKVR